jgi:serine phosphatase RsbU (regulator of sigma subunit)
MFTLEDGSTTIKYAAAKLHLIVVTPDGEISSEDGDKAGIGYFDTPADAVWKTYEITVPQGSVMTIATDGVIDQVGGPKKIAFGKKRIGTFVQKHLNQSAKELVTGFQQVYLDWQGEQKRRDDVSIFIFRHNP